MARISARDGRNVDETVTFFDETPPPDLTAGCAAAAAVAALGRKPLMSPAACWTVLLDRWAPNDLRIAAGVALDTHIQAGAAIPDGLATHCRTRHQARRWVADLTRTITPQP